MSTGEFRGNVGVAAVGDVLDINCWSNTPFFFYKAGEKANIFNEPWSLDTEKLALPRTLWNMGRLLTGKGAGGFQYSEFFLDRAEALIPEEYFSSVVISFNQLFPRASTVHARKGRIIYYIDVTLDDLFKEKEYGVNIPQSMKDRALAIEKENYAAAEGVLTMGSWVQESLHTRYSVNRNKTATILPGANIELPSAFVNVPWSGGAGRDRDFILGFVGKDWKRKGLDVVVAVRNELVTRGHRVVVRSIGNKPEEFKDAAGVEFTGFINKQNNAPEFIRAIGGCDLGCLFSTTEALGISVLEFLRVGVPVAGYYHQGLKDTLLEGASIRIEPGTDVKKVADQLERCILDSAFAKELKRGAETASDQVTWKRTVEKMEPWLHV